MQAETRQPNKKLNKAEGAKMDTVGERIAMARKSKGWDKKDLAKQMGVSKATVSDWENDKIKNLRMVHLINLSDLTGFSIPWLAIKRKPIHKTLLQNETEAELIALFRDMKPDTQQELLSTARRYYRSDHGDRATPLAPFPPIRELA